MRCVACGTFANIDRHHVTSVGAGGSDEPDNLMPLCRVHHVQVHKEGWSKMCQKWPGVQQWLWQNKRFDVLKKMQRINYNRKNDNRSF